MVFRVLLVGTWLFYCRLIWLPFETILIDCPASFTHSCPKETIYIIEQTLGDSANRCNLECLNKVHKLHQATIAHRNSTSPSYY